MSLIDAVLHAALHPEPRYKSDNEALAFSYVSDLHDMADIANHAFRNMRSPYFKTLSLIVNEASMPRTAEMKKIVHLHLLQTGKYVSYPSGVKERSLVLSFDLARGVFETFATHDLTGAKTTGMPKLHHTTDGLTRRNALSASVGFWLSRNFNNERLQVLVDQLSIDTDYDFNTGRPEDFGLRVNAAYDRFGIEPIT